MIVDNDEIALNIKILGKQIGTVLCIECLAKDLDCDVNKLKDMANYYKSTGCHIFQRKYTNYT